MDRKTPHAQRSLSRASAEPAYTRQPIASDTPARNWRERRQKARVIAEHIGGDEAEAKSWQSIK